MLLECVMEWSVMFPMDTVKHDISAFKKLYQNLVKKGVTFPSKKKYFVSPPPTGSSPTGGEQLPGLYKSASGSNKDSVTNPIASATAPPKRVETNPPKPLQQPHLTQSRIEDEEEEEKMQSAQHSRGPKNINDRQSNSSGTNSHSTSFVQPTLQNSFPSQDGNKGRPVLGGLNDQARQVDRALLINIFYIYKEQFNNIFNFYFH